MKIELNKNFAPNSTVDAYDVRQMKRALNRLGFYMPPKDTGITDMIDGAVFTALKTFQKARGLRATGMVRPEDETVTALNDALEEKPDGKYVWRTVGDDDVRPEHRELEGTIRSYADSPFPAEGYNCRCWAEKIEDIDDPPIVPVYPEAILLPAMRSRSIINLLGNSFAQVIRHLELSKVDMKDTGTWPSPPRAGKYREGAPSRLKPRNRGEKSLYDEKGGEWRYAKKDEYHNAHWDYKKNSKSPWENIRIDDKPAVKSEK